MIKFQKQLILLFFSAVILILDNFGFLDFIKLKVEPTIAPIKKTFYSSSQGIINFGRIISDYSNLKISADEKYNLQKTNSQLIWENTKLKEENAKLRQQLGAPVPSSYQFVQANILGVSRYMEIDAGTSAGIKKGMSVIIGNVLLGTVSEVNPARSIVRLLNDQDSKISAKTTRAVRGDVIGQSGIISLVKILQKETVLLGDEVVTSGEDNNPPNLLIGKIDFIAADDVSPYKSAKIVPPVDISKESTVFIIIST